MTWKDSNTENKTTNWTKWVSHKEQQQKAKCRTCGSYLNARLIYIIVINAYINARNIYIYS